MWPAALDTGDWHLQLILHAFSHILRQGDMTRQERPRSAGGRGEEGWGKPGGQFCCADFHAMRSAGSGTRR